MNDKIGVIFDGSLEGLFTIVYKHYYDKLNPIDIQAAGCFQQKLDVSYINIEVDLVYAEKVNESIFSKISYQAYKNIYKSFLYSDKIQQITNQKYLDIYHYILFGYKMGKSVDLYKTVGYILNVHKLSESVGKEAHLNLEFVRFSETTSGVFYGEFGPKHNVLPIVSPHFFDRFQKSQWVLRDAPRNICTICDGNNYITVETPENINLEFSKDEVKYRELWTNFFKTIAIEERVNKNLQRSNLPLRFRKYLSEFDN